MRIRFADWGYLFAAPGVLVLALVGGSAAAQNVNPATVRNLLNHAGAPSSPAPAHVQGPSSSAPSSAPKPSAPKASGPAQAKAPEPGAAAAPGAPSDHVVRRDPFESLLNAHSAGGETAEALPPGKPGLMINSLRIDGIIKGQNGMIAIVSNAQQRVYFIHEGDKLYDGSVEHITLEAVSFHELGKDAFGKPTDSEVTKRLYPSPGEQQ